MSRIRHLIGAAAGLALLALSAQGAQAQAIVSGAAPAQVALSATKVERLTLTLSTTALTNVDLAASNVVGNLNATMAWTLSPSRGNVHLVGWFGSTTAMTDGLATPNTVSTADFLGACTATNMTGASCSSVAAAFTDGADAAVGSTVGATRVLWSSPAITGTTRNQTGVLASLRFEINSAAVAALPAGTYTGTLNLRAYAQ